MIHVFHHIPKAAGTSCMAALGEWFELVKDYRAGTPVETPEAYGPTVDLSTLDDSQILCGHWEYPGYRIFERYPLLRDREDVRIITFLRHPLDTVVSMYHYGRRRNGTHLNETLDAHVAQCSDWLTHILGCAPDGVEAHLDQYWFVGLAERAQESFDLLADRLGKPRVGVPRENATAREGPAPSREAIAQFEARCPAWYRAYAYAVRRFESTRAGVTP